MVNILYSVSPVENFPPQTHYALLVPDGKFHFTENMLNADLCFSLLLFPKRLRYIIYGIGNCDFSKY